MTPDWHLINIDAPPAHGQRCFITDGDEVALAVADRGFRDKLYWSGSGFSGYEWDWDFVPTHWASAGAIVLPTA